MYTRLECELLANPNIGKVSHRFIGRLPLTAAINIGANIYPGEVLEYEVRPNQSGLCYLSISSAPLKVGLKRINGLGVETWMVQSVASVHALFKKLSKEERLNVDDKYKLVIENTSGSIVRASIGRT